MLRTHFVAASFVFWDAVSFSIALIFLVNLLDEREKLVLASLATVALAPRFVMRSALVGFKSQVPLSDQERGKPRSRF